jgi:small conductance mechanosensitive channel
MIQLPAPTRMPQFLVETGNLFRVDPYDLLRKLAAVAVVWLLAWLAMRLVAVVSRRILLAVADGDDTVMSRSEKHGATISQLVHSLGRFLVIALAVLLTLNQFIDIAPLLAGAGIVGLAFSFGAQSLVKDVITGFFLLLDDTIRVGDVVVVAGQTGTVERVSLRSVQLRDLDGTLHTIPNGQITTASNRTRGWGRAVVDVAVSYQTDLTRALDVLQDEATLLAADPAWTARVSGSPQVAGVQQLGADGATLRVLLRTPPGRQQEVAAEFRRRIKARLEREGIEHPQPQQTIRLQAAEPVESGPATRRPAGA